MLTVSLLGPLEVALDNQPLTALRSSKGLALLLYLLVETAVPEQTFPREALMALLWPDVPLKSAQESLRQTLYKLRKAVPDYSRDGRRESLLISGRQHVALSADYPLQSDVALFMEHLHDGQLREAAHLYRGDFLADFFLPDSSAFEAWAAARRAALRLRALEALEQLAEEALQTHDLENVARSARRQLALDPLRESALRQLLMALAAGGRRLDALAEFEQFASLLNEELAVPPSQETLGLMARIEADEFQPPSASLAVAAPDFEGEDTQETAVFVGREPELALLEDDWQAVRDRRSRLRFVIGGAGRGKTALLAAFASRLLDADERVLIASGHCTALAGVGDPYLPFRQAVAQLCGDVLSPAAGALLVPGQGRRLWSAIPQTVPALIEYAPGLVDTFVPGGELRQRAAVFAGRQEPWFRRLSQLLVRPYQDQLQQVALFSQVTALLKAITRDRPLLLVLEDLHWVDPASAALLFHLSRAMEDSRLMIIGTYRPDEIAAVPGLDSHPLAPILPEMKRQWGAIWLDLGQESPEQGRRFIELLLDSTPNDLGRPFREALFEHTGGHALFTVELLRSLLDRGELALDEDGRWRASETINWDALPPRIDGVIEQRLGHLDPQLRAALSAAAVEGESFTAEVLARVVDEPPGRLVTRLSDEVARRQRLIEPGSTVWVGEQRISRFNFRHQLFQQYLYQRMSQTDRAYRHEEVGVALEDLYGAQRERIAAQLAGHFTEAGRLDKALTYLILAARRALQLGVNEEAIAYCRRGLELLNRISVNQRPPRVELSLQATLGSALMGAKGFGDPEVKAAFERAHELLPLVGDVPERLPIMYGTWNFFFTRGDMTVSLARAQEILAYAEDSGDAMVALVAHKAMGVTLFMHGRLREALAHLEQVPLLADDQTRGALIALCGYDVSVSGPIFMAMTLTLLGHIDRGADACRQALAAARRLEHPFTLTFALAMKVILQHLRLDFAGSDATLAEQMDLSAAHGFVMWHVIGKMWQRFLQGLQGDAATRLEQMLQIIELSANLGISTMTSMTCCNLVYLQRCAGRPQEGLVLLDEGEAEIRRSQEHFYESELVRLRGELKRDLGYPAQEITADFERAITIARDQDARLLELRATTSLCRHWTATGRQEESRRRLSTLLAWFTEGFDKPDLQAAAEVLAVNGEQ